MRRYIKYKSIRAVWLFKWLGFNWDPNVTTKPYQFIETAKTGIRIVLFGKAIGINWNYDEMIMNYNRLTIATK